MYERCALWKKKTTKKNEPLLDKLCVTKHTQTFSAVPSVHVGACYYVCVRYCVSESETAGERFRKLWI